MFGHERCGCCDRLVILGRDVPDVPECRGHQALESCPQCNGAHDHVWYRALAVRGDWFDVVVRCAVCGAPKCEMVDCLERRQHRGPHHLRSGTVRRVGA